MKAILSRLTLSVFLLTGSAAVAETKRLDVTASEEAASQPVQHYTESRPSASTEGGLFSKGANSPVKTQAAAPTAADPVVERKYIPKSLTTKSAVIRERRQSGVISEYPYFEVPILFQVASDNLLDDVAAENVARTAELLKPHIASGARFQVEGHASAEGDPVYNEHFARIRAERIHELLTGKYQLSGACLTCKGFGTLFAQHAATSPEYLLRQDRRVLVVRVK